MEFLNTKEIALLLDKSGKYSDMDSISKIAPSLVDLHGKINWIHHQTSHFQNLKEIANFQIQGSGIYNRSMAEVVVCRQENELVLFEIADFGVAIFIKSNNNIDKIKEILENFIQAIQDPNSYIVNKRCEDLGKKIDIKSGNSTKIKI